MKAISGMFGGKPKKPQMVQQTTPVEQVQQNDVEKDKILKELGKRRRATVLAQLTAANVKRQRMGAA